MSSAAESKLRSLYINARKGVEERIILEEIGHPQPATPVQTDNSTAEGIIHMSIFSFYLLINIDRIRPLSHFSLQKVIRPLWEFRTCITKHITFWEWHIIVFHFKRLCFTSKGYLTNHCVRVSNVRVLIFRDHLEVGFTAKWPKKVSFDIKQLRWWLFRI
jgi:hypothetical protein